MAPCKQCWALAAPGAHPLLRCSPSLLLGTGTLETLPSASSSSLSAPGLSSRQCFDGERVGGCPGLPTRPHNACSVLGRRATLGPVNLSFVAQPPAAAPRAAAGCGPAAALLPQQHNGLLIPFLPPPPSGLLALHIPSTQRKCRQCANSASSQGLAGPRQRDGHLGLTHL